MLDFEEEATEVTSAPSQAEKGASGTSNPGTSASEEYYWGVRYFRARGLSKTAIIKEVWRVEGGRAFAQASAEYEAITRRLESERT